MTSPQGQDQVTASLLPCPFCGGVAEINQIGNEHTKSQGFEVKCLTWGCVTKKRAKVIRQPLEAARRYVIAAWNRRTPPPAVSEVREAAARIIDPDGWWAFDRQRAALKNMGRDPESELGPWMYVKRSIAKADSILALPLPRMGEGISLSQSQPSGDPGPQPRPAGEAVRPELGGRQLNALWTVLDDWAGNPSSSVAETADKVLDIIAYRIIPTDGRE